MMTTDEMLALRNAAAAVNATQASRAALSAREVARALSGVMQLVSKRHGATEMQRACAKLVRTLGSFDPTHALTEVEFTIAVVARGILPLCGKDAMTSALAFWASETDPAEWQRVAAGVAA